MSGGEEENDDKPFEATPRKLEEARKRGEIPKSNDLITAGAYAGFFLTAAVFGAASLQELGAGLAGLLDHSAELSRAFLADGGRHAAIGYMVNLGAALSAWAVLPIFLALLAVIGQRSFTVSGKKLQPKLSRVSPIENFKNKFGRNGLFEFLKSTVKLIIISVALGMYLWAKMPDLMQSMALHPNMGAALMTEMAVGFMGAVIAIMAAIGIVDFMWQYFEHLRKNRMSHQELKEEMKNSEGDPYLKQERRERGMAIAMNRMLDDVPQADVVVVNPEHYAVALKWDRMPGSAPVCVAKGVDNVALRIREKAEEARVPIHRDVPTARALYATTEIGAQIAPEHYRAVAAAIRFAEKVRQKAARRHGG